VVAVLEGLVTIYIVSAGRSGSGWLSSVLAGCGLRVVHEWTPYNVVDPEVVSSTEWIWNQRSFLASLTMDDVVIVLDREKEAREASVDKLLGTHDWSLLNDRWRILRDSIFYKMDLLWVSIDYEDLFGEEGYEAVKRVLHIAKRDTSNLRNMWDFMVHMRVTNKTSEQIVKESYGL
jgi:hypothetical protein